MHREAGTHSIPATAFDFALVREVLNDGTRELRGCSIDIVPGGGFNIHRLVKHDPQASDSCSRESSKVENHSIFHGLIFPVNR